MSNPSSILLANRRGIDDANSNKVVVVYGAPKTGKTTLAASFPKPLLIIDINEDGTDSISLEDRKGIDVVSARNFEELDSYLQDLYRGYGLDSDGNKVELKYATIVMDTATQMEYVYQKFLMRRDNKANMDLNLYGKSKKGQVDLFLMGKTLSSIHDCWLVLIAHEKEIRNEERPEKAKMIPALQEGVARDLAGKASYIWYTRLETVIEVDATNKIITDEQGVPVKSIDFVTYIGPHDYYESASRVPKGMKIPQRVRNMTFNKFKINVLDVATKLRDEAKKTIKSKPVGPTTPVNPAPVPKEETNTPAPAPAPAKEKADDPGDF
jgi:hypothetical protein